ncbi:MAG: sugar kinase [Pseudomonadota bacterium]
MLDVLCLGEALVEFNQTDGDRYLRGYGGDTSNCAVAASRQGACAGYFTQVGVDTFGEELLTLWRKEGIDVSTVRQEPSAPTGIYFISHDADGHRFTYRRAGSAASLMTPTRLPRELLRRCRYLQFSAISQAISDSACDTCFEALAVAREAGVTVAYDTNLRLNLWPLARARAVVMATLENVDIALPGLDDARALTGLDEPQAILDLFLEAGVRIVALTMGADGVWIASSEERERLPAHRVNCVDATAAGDVFDGALLARLADGDALREAARYANVAAALSTTGFGAVGPIPRADAVRAALASP